MASKIITTNIDINYPIAGQDNDTKGFRDNFNAIRNNFITSSSEISSIQSTLSVVPTYTNIPISPTSVGTAGQIAYDENFWYVCIATNTWAKYPSTLGLSLLAYGDGNVATYIPTDPTISTLVNGFNSYKTFANTTFLTSSSSVVQAINANVGAYQIANNANLGLVYTHVNTLDANVGTYIISYGTYANSNASIQAIGINNLNANVGAFHTYANTALGSLATGANANTAAYLSGANVNISSAFITSNLNVGNLTVRGTTTTLNSTTTSIGNLLLVLGANATSSIQSNAAGISLSGTAANILYYSSTNSWTFNIPTVSVGNVTGANLVTLGNVYATGYIGTHYGNVIGTAANATYSVNAINSINATNATAATVATYVTGLTSSNVTTALTFTPLSATSNVNTTIRSLGVGTAPSGTVGEIRAIGDITGFYSSDAQFKENVQPIAGALDMVEAIGGKTFEWNDEYITAHGGDDGYFVQKQDFGVVAQDVQRVFPLAVRTRPDGSLAVDYAKLTALAFAAIAELKAEVDRLKGQ